MVVFPFSTWLVSHAETSVWRLQLGVSSSTVHGSHPQTRRRRPCLTLQCPPATPRCPRRRQRRIARFLFVAPMHRLRECCFSCGLHMYVHVSQGSREIAYWDQCWFNRTPLKDKKYKASPACWLAKLEAFAVVCACVRQGSRGIAHWDHCRFASFSSSAIRLH